jgi:signal peptidase II
MLKRLVAIGIAAVVIALDQLSKTWIMQHFQPGGAQRVTDFFDLVYARNTGAAFSLYADQPGWQRAFFITIALFASAVILLLLQRKSLSLMARIGLGLVLGGALANVFDRMTLGYVVDFLWFHIQQYGWPAFNVADSAIVLGATILIFDGMKTSSPDTANDHSADHTTR